MSQSRRFVNRPVLIAGHPPALNAIADRLDAEGARLVRVDATDRSLTRDGEAAAAVAAAAAELGAIDVLVTAFDHREDADLLEIDDESWDRSLDVNLKTPFLLAREVARVMAEGQGGVIVHVSDVTVAAPEAGSGAYVAAKAGGQLMSSVMALDLVPQGVRVCTVAGSSAGSPVGLDDLAGAVAFCASDDASYVLGSVLTLDAALPGRR